MESTLKEQFDKEKSQYEKKIKDLEGTVYELQDYGDKKELYYQEMAQLKHALEKEKKDNPKLKSDRILKSATPKYTIDWYVKWVASILVLAAMSTRGVEGLVFWDLVLSKRRSV